jgi:hypothetical protein
MDADRARLLELADEQDSEADALERDGNWHRGHGEPL